MYLILVTATILLASVSCGQHREVPVSMIGVKEVVARLDSAVAAIYGMEPTDSTFNDSIASQIIDIMDENASKHPDADLGERGKFASMQKAHDEAKATWAEFKRLCDADRWPIAIAEYSLRIVEAVKSSTSIIPSIISSVIWGYLFSTVTARLSTVFSSPRIGLFAWMEKMITADRNAMRRQPSCIRQEVKRRAKICCAVVAGRLKAKYPPSPSSP